ncbi:MAG: YdbL family protein [bacterium]|nr:YdbL family protein [bacterium]
MKHLKSKAIFARRAVYLGALLAGLAGGHCAIIQPIRDPAMQLLRRGACISVDIPPITLTPERTAAERQLIGTEGEIESEGWLIASAQSASPEGRVPGARAVAGSNDLDALYGENRRYRIEAGVLDFYNPTVLKFRSQELLGEGFDGRLRVVPANLSRARFSEESDTAAEVAREVNRARLWIYEYLRSEARKTDDAKLQSLRDQYLTRWYNEARSRSGEWIYSDRRQWLRAR